MDASNTSPVLKCVRCGGLAATTWINNGCPYCLAIFVEELKSTRRAPREEK
jgi:hypothetical protein